MCALDALLAQNANPTDRSLITAAYATATEPYPLHRIAITDPKIVARAHAAYKHDAVQSMLERLKFRGLRRKRIEMENSVYDEVKRMVADAATLGAENMLERKQAIDAATALMKLGNAEDAVVRAERSRRGMARAREALAQDSTNDNPRVMKTMLKALASKLPKDEVRDILRTLDEPAIEADTSQAS